MKHSKLPSTDQVDQLLSFLPLFSDPELVVVVRWAGGAEPDGSYVLPAPIYQSAFMEFIRAASEDCWMDPEYLSVDVNRLLADPNLLHQADIDQLRAVLTFIVRGERFCDGHWATMVERGHVIRLLQRLKELQ